MTDPLIKRDVIVIGASAGGVSALRQLCGALPKELPAVVGIVIHRSRWFHSDMSAVYGRPGQIRVQEARSGDKLEQGIVYFAPADYHMVFESTHVRLSREAKVHFCRPAIDQLFISASRAFGIRVVGVLLTGSNTDGAQGLVHIKQHKGLTFVQRPEEAAHPEMPLSGLREDEPGLVSLNVLPALLISLASGQPIAVEQS